MFVFLQHQRNPKGGVPKVSPMLSICATASLQNKFKSCDSGPTRATITF